MTKVKICGLHTMQDIDYVNQARPDYAGFVFADFSSRYVTDTQAEKLSRQLQPDIIPVGVFWDHPVDFVADLLNRHVIQIAQLHHHEDEDYIRQLRALTKAPIIKAFKVTCEKDIQTACQSTADFILLDNHIPGSGQRFDWSLLKGIQRPFFLAGGLSPDNVCEALQIHPYALDVSSGVETDKIKDLSKMKTFVQTVRDFDTSQNCT